MEDMNSFIEIVDVLLSQPQEGSTAVTRVLAEVKITKATDLSYQQAESDSIDRAKAAQVLRLIAHRLMTGTLGLLFAISAGACSQMIDDDPISSPEQHNLTAALRLTD
jgi:hypothetical protein